MLFVVFALVFISSRNVLFPMYVIAPAIKYGYITHGDPLAMAIPNFVRDALVGALCILECMHVFWAFLVFCS